MVPMAVATRNLLVKFGISGVLTNSVLNLHSLGTDPILWQIYQSSECHFGEALWGDFP